MRGRILAIVTALAALAHAQAPDSSNGWGYPYASLLKDLERWRAKPHARVDSVGASAQGRGLWMVTVTDGGDSLGSGGWRKHRVFFHVRTHPSEVQAEHVANAAIDFLLGGTAEAAELRKDFIFNIIPMYNPDGVETGRARENGRGVNLEVNWDTPDPEPEVKALRALFQRLMAGPIPIEVALNLHSDQFSCKRFFVFHPAGGTSAAFVNMEKDFIAKVQARFPGAVEDWDFQVSTNWATAPQARYPEGFWWLNHGDKVMALTYEDANCAGAGRYDSTGRALALGSADYIRGRIIASVAAAPGSDGYRLSARGGALVLTGPAERGRVPWAVVDAGGRLLAQGSLEHGSALIPAGLSTRASWLMVGGGGPRRAFPLPNLAP